METVRRDDANTFTPPTGDYDVGAAFDEHSIEWWVYDGERLVPALPEQAEMFSRLHDHPPQTLLRQGRLRGFRCRLMGQLPVPSARMS